jgi:hypothetical protein
VNDKPIQQPSFAEMFTPKLMAVLREDTGRRGKSKPPIHLLSGLYFPGLPPAYKSNTFLWRVSRRPCIRHRDDAVLLCSTINPMLPVCS